MPAHMKAVDVKYVNVPAASNSKIVLLDEKDDIPIHLNVTLNIPGQAYVLGRALTSEWSGSITFTGTTDHVLTNGELNLLSGDYIFNGRSLMGANGTIHFAGDPATKTTLYVTASQEIDEYHVEMILKGPVHDPVLAFRSNPPLSKKEILSLVLFNSKISEITPFQGAQLSQTVISLSDGMDKSDTLSRIRNSIGIDRIDISSVDTCDSNEVTIRVGKYISRGLFVSVNKSITADKNQVAIEANVTRHIKMKGEVGDDAEANLNLRWENQY
jgi:translocation and assembly module TamB